MVIQRTWELLEFIEDKKTTQPNDKTKKQSLILSFTEHIRQIVLN